MSSTGKSEPHASRRIPGPGRALQAALARRSEPHDVLAPVVRVLAALDEALELKVVDQRDHRRAVDVHRAGDLALRDRAARVDRPEHGGLAPVDPERRERDRAELEESELRVLEQVPQMRVFTMGGHEHKSMNKLIVRDTDDQSY